MKIVESIVCSHDNYPCVLVAKANAMESSSLVRPSSWPALFLFTCSLNKVWTSAFMSKNFEMQVYLLNLIQEWKIMER